MLRVWPPIHPEEDHEGSHSDAEASIMLPECASLPRQAMHLDAQSGGWVITIDSAIETGKIEFFIPQNRNEAVRIISDTRAESKKLPFERLFSQGYYAEAVLAAEEKLQELRDSITASERDSKSGGIQDLTSVRSHALVQTLRQIVAASLRSGNYERLESAANEALAVCQQAPTDYAESLVRILHDRVYGRYLYRCRDEESAIEVRRELTTARQRAEQLLGREHSETARIMTTQARLLISDFSYPEAEDLLSEAIRIRTRLLGSEHADVSESLLEQARLNAYREDHDEADEGFQRAIAIREAQFGLHHPDVAEALFHYTDFLIYNRRDTAKAGPLLRRALSIWDATIGLEHSPAARDSEFIRKVLSVDTDAEAESAE
ncbi:MAG: tetratricopeptide repeat protein [Schlesneria sp.]